MPERRPLIAGNWKMNTKLDEATKLARSVADGVTLREKVEAECLVIPPFPWIVPVREVVAGSSVAVGAQKCAVEDAGAFTGEVSAAMLAPLCGYIVIGHSERRHVFGESDDVVAAKLQAVLRNGVTPILCVGETLEQRDGGEAGAVVERQISSALGEMPEDAIAGVVVAYEPVWAIGTGRAASPDDAARMADTIRATVAHIAGSQASSSVRILYGGSVNPANAGSFIGLEDIDGALVGGASLKAESFLEILDAAG